MSIEFIDLFGGAGGWSLGLQMAGLKHCGLYEIDEAACETARFNLGHEVQCVDLTNHRLHRGLQGIDLVVGSPPCQGFSNEGYKRASDPRNTLVWKFFDHVELLRPRVWIFENVPGFKRLYGGRFYSKLTQRLQAMPYKTKTFLLDASHYGVPQRRLRFFAIGTLDCEVEMPEQAHANEEDLFGREPSVTLWEAISDLPEVGTGERLGVFDYTKSASTGYQEWVREGSRLVHNHTTQRHSKRVVEKIRSVSMGSGMHHFVGTYGENGVAYEGGYRRALKDAPSYTAYWTRGMTSIHPEQHRFMSPRECARIQSFPDRFIFRGTSIQNYTQVCNAVPPLMARAFGRELQRAICNRYVEPVPWTRRATRARFPGKNRPHVPGRSRL